MRKYFTSNCENAACTAKKLNHKIMKRIFIAAAAVLISSTVFLSSCKKDNDNGPSYSIPSNLKLLASGYATRSATRVEYVHQTSGLEKSVY